MPANNFTPFLPQHDFQQGGTRVRMLLLTRLDGEIGNGSAIPSENLVITLDELRSTGISIT